MNGISLTARRPGLCRYALYLCLLLLLPFLSSLARADDGSEYITDVQQEITGYVCVTTVWFSYPYGSYIRFTDDADTNAWLHFKDDCKLSDHDPGYADGSALGPENEDDARSKWYGSQSTEQFAFSSTFNYSDERFQTLGPADSLELDDVGSGPTVDGVPTPGPTATIDHPKAQGGETLVEVSLTPDGTHMLPAPGASIEWYGPAGTKYERKILAQRTGVTGTFALFGNRVGDNSNSATQQVTDSDYPEGLADENYTIAATCNGNTATLTGKGILLASGAIHLVINTASGAGSGQVYQGTNGVPPTTDDGSTVANIPPVDGSGSGGSGSGSGSGTSIFPQSVLDWFNNFWDTLKTFLGTVFEPQQSHIDELKASAATLFSWGPLSLPAQIQAEWTQAFGSFGTETDPNYWVINLNPWANGNGLYNSHPAGVNAPNGQGILDPAESDQVTYLANSLNGYFPSTISVIRYRAEISAARSCMALGIWAFFAFEVFALIRPKLQM